MTNKQWSIALTALLVPLVGSGYIWLVNWIERKVREMKPGKFRTVLLLGRTTEPPSQH